MTDDDEAAELVTESHLAYVRATCRRLSHTTYGTMVDYDEIYSQALVTVWELALSFDADREVPFGAYLAVNLRRRLIDWLRTAYGRLGSPRAGFHMRQNSLDGIIEWRGSNAFPSMAPSVEERIADRETLAAVLDRARDSLTLREAMALLEPVISDEDRDDFWDRAGTNRGTQYVHKTHARRRIAALVDDVRYTSRQRRSRPAPLPGQRRPKNNS